MDQHVTGLKPFEPKIPFRRESGIVSEVLVRIEPVRSVRMRRAISHLEHLPTLRNMYGVVLELLLSYQHVQRALFVVPKPHFWTVMAIR